MQRCGACGLAAPLHARFCRGCGGSLPARAATDPRIFAAPGAGFRCQQCGKELSAPARFCRRCGAPASPPPAERAAPKAGPSRRRTIGALAAAFLTAATFSAGGVYWLVLDEDVSDGQAATADTGSTVETGDEGDTNTEGTARSDSAARPETAGAAPPITEAAVRALLEQYAALYSAEELGGFQALLAPSLRRVTVGEGEENFAEAVGSYSDQFGALQRPEYSLSMDALSVGSKSAIADGAYVISDAGARVSEGLIQFRVVPLGGRLVIDRMVVDP